MSRQTNEFEIWITEEKEKKEERRKQNKITNKSLGMIMRKGERTEAEITNNRSYDKVKRWKKKGGWGGSSF